MAHDYLTVADVLGMLTVPMQRYGGAPGVREPGALAAALCRFVMVKDKQWDWIEKMPSPSLARQS